jgi:hypothetical protein
LGHQYPAKPDHDLANLNHIRTPREGLQNFVLWLSISRKSLIQLTLDPGDVGFCRPSLGLHRS